MMTPDQFFQSLLPPFQNNSVNILSFLFENKPSIAKNDFLTKCANLNLFPREQILYIYSKIDTTFAGRIDRQQIEPFFGPHLQRLSYSSQGYPQTPVQQTPNLYGSREFSREYSSHSSSRKLSSTKSSVQLPSSTNSREFSTTTTTTTKLFAP